MTPKDLKTYKIDSPYPAVYGSCRLLVGCRAESYSASSIARAVEDCDAHLLNLNVMPGYDYGYDMIVDLRVDHARPQAAARSLERYGYEVIDACSDSEDCDDDAADDTLRRRVDELIRYLNI